MYKPQLDRVSLSAELLSSLSTQTASALSPAALPALGTASGSGHAPATLVKLLVVGADVVSHIFLPEKRLAAQRAWPVLALDVPHAMHDESVAVPVGGVALQAGVGRLGSLGDLTARTPQLFKACPTDRLRQGRALAAQGEQFPLLLW